MALFVLAGALLTQEQNKTFQSEAREFEPDNGKSYLGTPIYSYIEFPEGRYKVPRSSQNNAPVGNDTVQFDGVKITSVLVEVSQTKNIVTTAIQGKNGTIKEYVSDGDYNISVMGRIVNEQNSFPEIALNALKEICKVPDSLNVNCPFLQYFDITAAVILDYRFNEVEGSRNMVEFSINMLSDVPPIQDGFTKQSRSGQLNFSNTTLQEFQVPQ